LPGGAGLDGTLHGTGRRRRPLTQADEPADLRDRLREVLAEDTQNGERLLGRLELLRQETGLGAHAAILLVLTQLRMEDDEARKVWDAALAHRHEMSLALGRDVGVRVALVDYFVNVNRRLVRPTLIDLEMFESEASSSPVDRTTGLATDRAFRTAVQSELRRAKRYAQRVSVVLFDLDGFAAVNERVGRAVADRLLRETAILLHNKVRDIDLAARPGEDEMALVLPETDRNGAHLVAERFRREVEVHFHRREAGGKSVGLTVSGGVASYPGDASTAEALIESAARALYMAKASGRNVVQVFQAERRRFLRFDLEPDRFEIEVLTARGAGPGRLRNLSRNGIVFGSPEALQVGEEIEIRLAGGHAAGPSARLRLRGRVVRLEELPEGGTEIPGDEAAPDTGDRFEIGMVVEADDSDGRRSLLEFLEATSATTHRP
jgi:diguanylate cyclase (GGDEF)-like protein